MRVRRANAQDIAQIVAVHQRAFPGFFLTSLGEPFLRRFYGAIVCNDDAMCFIGSLPDGVAGFVVGPLQPAGFFRKLLLRDGFAFCRDALPALVRQPLHVGKRLLRGLTYRGEVPAMQARAALVSSIAVLPNASGTGLAAALLDAFCREAEARGASCVYLLTDRDYNPAANRFYVKVGFTLEAEIVRGPDRTMNRYVRELARSNAE